MNKLVVAIILTFITTISWSQFDSKGEVRSRFRPGTMWYFTGLKPAKVDKVRKYDRLIFDLTYNDWVGDRGPFQNHWASIGFNTNMMFDIPLAPGNKVALGIGLAHQLFYIRHNGNLTINDSLGTTMWEPKMNGQEFKKSSLGGNSFSIPIELRFRNESWRHFKFHMGGRVGYQTNMFTRTVVPGDHGDLVSKQKGFPDQNDLLYSAHFRIGLRNWALYGSYNFNNLFKNSQSSQLNLLQIGISISMF